MRLAKPECVCGRWPAQAVARPGACAHRFPTNRTAADIPRSALGAGRRGRIPGHPCAPFPWHALGCAQDGRAVAFPAAAPHSDWSQTRGAGCAPLVCPRRAAGPARPRHGPSPAHLDPIDTSLYQLA